MVRIRSFLTLRVIFALCVLASLGLGFAYVAGFIPSKAERKGDEIASLIKQHLTAPGQWKRVEDVYPGAWTQVCVHPSMSTGGALNREILERKFKLPPNSLRFPNGLPGSSDWNWVLMFFYPPNTLEMFAVGNEHLFGGLFHVDEHKRPYPGCRSKEEALFGIRESSLKGKPHRHLTLANSEQKRRIIELEEIND